MSKGRKPHFRLSAYDKVTQRSNTVGVAWKNDNGSISVSINLGCVLGLQPTLVYNLWPLDDSRPQETNDDREPNYDDGSF